MGVIHVSSPTTRYLEAFEDFDGILFPAQIADDEVELRAQFERRDGNTLPVVLQNHRAGTERARLVHTPTPMEVTA